MDHAALCIYEWHKHIHPAPAHTPTDKLESSAQVWQ